MKINLKNPEDRDLYAMWALNDRHVTHSPHARRLHVRDSTIMCEAMRPISECVRRAELDKRSNGIILR